MSLQERFNQLEEREKKLLIIFFGVLGTMVFVLIPTLIRMGVSDQRAENERIKQVIASIEDERFTLSRRKAEVERVEKRYQRTTPALASFLAKKADEVGLEIPETEDRSTVPRGKKFKERSARIHLKKVGMLALSNFMESVENSGYPVSISRLVIKKRGSEPDQYDVEMDVSAFDREEKKSKSGQSDGAKSEEP